MRRRLLSALLMAFAGPVSANAECPQELAIYAEAQAGAELTFIPDGNGLYAPFTIRFPEHDVALDGVILAGDAPVLRPWAIVMHDCPQGDATGDEIAACTIWEGPVYGLDRQGNVFHLPQAGNGDGAAATILLPDFSTAVRLSKLWGAEGLSTAPKDDFQLKGCQE